MGDYLIRCKDCGHGLQPSDLLQSAKEIAERETCRKCHSQKIEIVEREREVDVQVSEEEMNKEQKD